MVGVAVVRAARFLWGVRCHRKALGAGRWQATQQHSPNAQVKPARITGTFHVASIGLDASVVTDHPSPLAVAGGLTPPQKPKYGPHFRERRNDD
jgi:hypothetical protein